MGGKGNDKDSVKGSNGDNNNVNNKASTTTNQPLHKKITTIPEIIIIDSDSSSDNDDNDVSKSNTPSSSSSFSSSTSSSSSSSSSSYVSSSSSSPSSKFSSCSAFSSCSSTRSRRRQRNDNRVVAKAIHREKARRAAEVEARNKEKGEVTASNEISNELIRVNPDINNQRGQSSNDSYISLPSLPSTTKKRPRQQRNGTKIVAKAKTKTDNGVPKEITQRVKVSLEKKRTIIVKEAKAKETTKVAKTKTKTKVKAKIPKTRAFSDDVIAKENNKAKIVNNIRITKKAKTVNSRELRKTKDRAKLIGIKNKYIPEEAVNNNNKVAKTNIVNNEITTNPANASTAASFTNAISVTPNDGNAQLGSNAKFHTQRKKERKVKKIAKAVDIKNKDTKGAKIKVEVKMEKSKPNNNMTQIVIPNNTTIKEKNNNKNESFKKTVVEVNKEKAEAKATTHNMTKELSIAIINRTKRKANKDSYNNEIKQTKQLELNTPPKKDKSYNEDNNIENNNK